MRRLIAVAFFVACVWRFTIAHAALPPSTFSYDAGRPLDVRVVRTSREGRATLEEVTFASPYGKRIHAEIVRSGSAATHPGVLFVHWLGDKKTTNLTEFLPDARALAARGVTSVLVDAMWAQPGWFDKVRKPDSDYDESIRQVVDLRRSLDVLEAQPNVDPQRIAYVGHDFGAMYGALLSAVDVRPKYYVLMAGSTSFSDWYLLGAAPHDKRAYVARMRALDPPAYLARSQARRFLFQYALHDEYVPLAAAQSFAAAAPGERGVLFYNADHGLGGAEIQDDRLAWLLTRLRSASAR